MRPAGAAGTPHLRDWAVSRGPAGLLQRLQADYDEEVQDHQRTARQHTLIEHLCDRLTEAERLRDDITHPDTARQSQTEQDKRVYRRAGL